MKLHEYQSKRIFLSNRIPIPKGRIASSANEVKLIAEELGGNVVIKAQVLVGGRAKAGGIRLAKNVSEAVDFATLLLGMDLKGLPVRKVLVDEVVKFTTEVYLAIINDREHCCPVVLASPNGGVDIEELTAKEPGKLARFYIDPILGLMDYQSREIAESIDIPRSKWKLFTNIASQLWNIYWANDATLVEINPLVLDDRGEFIALDAKMVIDDNALFRHIDLAEMRDLDEVDPIESEARKYGLSYVKLDGDIGCMVNGAGLAMATTDIIKLSGGKPANFLDIGGGANADKVAVALKMVLSDPKVRAIFVNIFGGITRCDEVAKGILTVLEENKPSLPIVVRLVGTHSEQAINKLLTTQVIFADSLYDGAQKAINLARENR